MIGLEHSVDSHRYSGHFCHAGSEPGSIFEPQSPLLPRPTLWRSCTWPWGSGGEGVRMKQSDETSWRRGGVRSHKMGVCESVSKKKRGGRGYGCA